MQGLRFHQILIGICPPVNFSLVLVASSLDSKEEEGNEGLAFQKIGCFLGQEVGESSQDLAVGREAMVVDRKPDYRGKKGLGSLKCLALLISLARSGGRKWETGSKGGFFTPRAEMCHIEINRRKETG